MPELPPESAVHLKEWDFASAADCRNAGYRRIGNEYVRIDLAERVIKKAHEARGEALEFGMDMAFATSLGLSEEGLQALMRDAGFRRIESLSVATVAEAVNVDAETVENTVEASDAREPDAVLVADEPAKAAPLEEAAMEESITAEPVTVDAAEENGAEAEPAKTDATNDQAVKLTYWRWVGIRKAKPAPRLAKSHDRKPKKGGKPVQNRQPAAAPAKPKSEAPSALALQLAALKEKMGG
jgi:ATP-dependent RNA helicase SUPV3L1/SUV3